MVKWEMVPTEPLLSRRSWVMGRTKVPGGWLVFVRSNSGGSGDGPPDTVTLTFYPDPEYNWRP
jgi:hypothetical protein